MTHEFAGTLHPKLSSASNEAQEARFGKFNLTSTNIEDLVHDLRQPLQTLALLNGALRRMVIEPEPAEALAIGAMSRLLNALEQVLQNLISNAIKYTQLGYVHLRCLHDAAIVRLELLDTGIGIPAAALAHIYDEFHQVDVPTNTSRDGYGLGLSIVQRIVKLLGLKLEVRSELGKGSQFSL